MTLDEMQRDTGPIRGYEPLLVEMLAMYPTCRASGPLEVRDGWGEVAYLAHGWYLRCHRGAEALLLLDAAGYGEEASPIRRSMIEHALAPRWLAAEGSSILSTIAGGQAKSATRRVDAVSKAGWTSVDLDEARSAVASADAARLDRSNDYLLQFASRVQKYGDKHIMPVYLSECARTHPGYESAVCYVEIEPPKRGEHLMESRDTVWQVPFAATHLLVALLALREIFDPKPWQGQLENLLDQYRKVTDLVRSQDGLAPVDWSTGELVEAEMSIEVTRS
jgi:hypothetical protein